MTSALEGSELLERRVARIERRRAKLEQANARFSWLRLAVLVAGGAAVWLANLQAGGRLGWSVFAAAAAVFIAVLALHRRLDQARLRLRLWDEIQRTHLARCRLDWANIPPGPAQAEPPLSKRSALDVDLDLTGERSLHRLVDCAVSAEGSRLLAQRLTRGRADPQEVEAVQALVRELKPMQHFRDRLALAFRLASREHLDGQKLLGWLDEAYGSERLRWALPVAALWAALNWGLFALEVAGRLPPLWTLSLTFYLAFYYFNIRIFQGMLAEIVGLEAELRKFRPPLERLERTGLQGKPHLAALLKPLRAPGDCPSRQLRRMAWITAGVGLRSNPVMGVLLNLLLPWDYVFAALAARQRDRLRAALPAWFAAFAELEAAGSTANFAHWNPGFAFPSLDTAARPVFAAEGLAHPLIAPEQAVRNDFQIEALGRIAVITGSNMAGKSTFIKAVGANLCLAYAGGPVSARRLHTRPFRLYSVVRISDSISDGYSYFYAEVRRLKGLLELLDQPGPPVLYLIDEIFRGTNNRERLIGSRSVLQALMTKNGAGLLSTHDLELATLADENEHAANYHFRDAVSDGRLTFDYTLRPGPSPTTNALRIMAMEGLPVDPAQAARGEQKKDLPGL